MASLEPLRLSLIAAVAENGIIGAEGEMPWKLLTDLRRFRSITTGKPIIMGRKTFDSIGRPLPQRVNIVLTRDPAFTAPGTVAVPTLDSAMTAAIAAAAASDVVEAIVVGGGEVYAAMMARAERLYITHVATSPQGDTRFPEMAPDEWAAVSEEIVPAGAADSHATRFVVYQRRGR